jgi:hypothetical protein
VVVGVGPYFLGTKRGAYEHRPGGKRSRRTRRGGKGAGRKGDRGERERGEGVYHPAADQRLCSGPRRIDDRSHSRVQLTELSLHPSHPGSDTLVQDQA